MSEKTADEIVKELESHFDPDDISWRIGLRKGDRGLALAYIDARNVMRRLDAVVGSQHWQDEYRVVQTTKSMFDKKQHVGEEQDILFLCRLSLRIEGEWIAKEDAAGVTDIESGKGGCSDSFKRAAVKWGVGRYLYDLDSPWVNLTENGYGIHPNEKSRLRALLSQKAGVPAVHQEPEPQKEPQATREVRDELAMFNKKVMLQYGYSEEEYMAMLPTERFAPLEFALRRMGFGNLGVLPIKRVDELKGVMTEWKKLDAPPEEPGSRG